MALFLIKSEFQFKFFASLTQNNRIIFKIVMKYIYVYIYACVCIYINRKFAILSALSIQKSGLPYIDCVVQSAVLSASKIPS